MIAEEPDNLPTERDRQECGITEAKQFVYGFTETDEKEGKKKHVCNRNW